MNNNGLYEINLLRFHRMGATKWEQRGKKYEYSDHGDMPEERMLELQERYLKLFLHTIYSVSNLIDMLYFVLIYTQKDFSLYVLL